MPLCPVCRHTLVTGIRDWHLVCKACDYEKANLAPSINEAASHETIDEATRESGLRALRIKNFRTLLDRIGEVATSGSRLLEVGSAHGWFLDEALKKYSVTGIEPDNAIFSASAKGRPFIRNGYFPEILDADERFDIIVFNDVLEHIPDVTGTLSACHRHLNSGGLLVINIPSSRGVFYRASKLFARIGLGMPFSRMWQESLPSPHLHYFSADNLSRLLSSSGFEMITEGRLPSIELAGLRSRIGYTSRSNAAIDTMILFGTAATFPMIRILPSDIMYIVARRRDKSRIDKRNP